MKVWLAKCIVLAGFLGNILTVFPAPYPHPETVFGRVVAYSNALVCLNGNAYWSLIIRLQDPKGDRGKFVRLEFSTPCSESPEWLTAKSSFRKFRLIREKDLDAVLKEFWDCTNESNPDTPCPAIKMWKRPPGAEHGVLPFGKVVPAYRSADLPLAPVV